MLDEWALTLSGRRSTADEVSAAWVAPVTRADGSAAVLKLGMPHMEGEHEIDGLRFWDGDPTVRLLEAAAGANAMLLERCEPGTVLRELPEPEQDVVIAGLLRRLWRSVPEPHVFRPLAEMTAAWRDETQADFPPRRDVGLVREGLRLFEELPRTASRHVLLATDLHAGNVLRARREPWLVIDPKPFVGDPAYDATQHLLNCRRLRTRPLRGDRALRRPAGARPRARPPLDVRPRGRRVRGRLGRSAPTRGCACPLGAEQEPLERLERPLERRDLDLLVDRVRVARRAGAEVDRVEAARGEVGDVRPRLLRLHLEVADAAQLLDQAVAAATCAAGEFWTISTSLAGQLAHALLGLGSGVRSGA